MKVIFEDKSYIEVKRSNEQGKILVIISAKDNDNSLKKITNVVEITDDEFKKLLSDIN